MSTNRKFIDLGLIVVAELASDYIVRLGWKIVTGKNPPEADDFEVGLTELVIFSVLSGLLMTITKRLTVRTASRLYGKKHSRPNHTQPI